MIYVVTGRHRTGTSMMMRALSQASTVLTPYVDMDIEQRIRERQVDADYDPNPNGYYQSGLIDFTDLPDDTLVKVTAYTWASLKLRLPETIEVLHMTRDERDRTVSFRRSFGAVEQIDLYEAGERALIDVLPANVTTFDYDQVVADPLESFDTLVDYGWPIDPEVAAALIDPSLHRNRG